MEPIFFTTTDELRTWYAENHDKTTELWLGHYKKAAKKPTLTYHEALDEALCYGWIDGIRKTLDEERYVQRYTPRQKRSIWSQVNIKRVGDLIAAGRMQPAGLKAFEARDEKRMNQYSFENVEKPFSPEHEARFKEDAKAWEWFEKAAPSYRRSCLYWVNSAKQEATRLRRLDALIEYSAKGQKVPAFNSKASKPD